MKKATAKKKRPKYNRKSKITSALRRIWFFGPERREVMKEAKEKNFECSICKVPNSDLQVDHIVPVVPTDGKEYNWQDYIDRLFCPPEGLRAICKGCHKVFTALSSAERKINKK